MFEDILAVGFMYRTKPLKNVQFCSKSRKAKIITLPISIGTDMNTFKYFED
jgi:hypothetical protein